MSGNEQWFPGTLRELSQEECLELMSTHRVGRVGWQDEAGVSIIPVNHVLHGRDVIISTDPDSVLAHRVETESVSFQIDDIDEYNQSGWSVLVRGRLEQVPAQELEASDLPRPAQWVEEPRHLVLRIVPTTITGRRLLAR